MALAVRLHEGAGPEAPTALAQRISLAIAFTV